MAGTLRGRDHPDTGAQRGREREKEEDSDAGELVPK